MKSDSHRRPSTSEPDRAARRPSKATKWAAALAVLCGAAALVAWLTSTGKRRAPEPASRRRPEPPVVVADEPASVAAPAAEARTDVLAAIEAQTRISTAPLIGEVEIEKGTVCPGEDFKISIHPTEGQEATEFEIEGRNGRELILTASGHDNGDTPGREAYWIGASNGNKVDYRKVSVAVLREDDPRCSRMPAVTIRVTPDDGHPDQISFEVSPLRALGRIAKSEWTFGDEHKETVQGTRTKHGYEDRPQQEDTSVFVVGVFATDTEGRHAWGRASVSIRNLYFMARSGGDRPLPVEYSRFAPSDGSRVFRLKVNNIESRPVALDRAVVKTETCLAGDEPREETIPAADLVSRTDLAAGTFTETSIELGPHWMRPGVCRVSVTLIGDTVPPSVGVPLEGRSVPRRPITIDATFHLSRPRTVEEGGDPEVASRPVTDPELMARLAEYIQKHGSGRVTQEELDAANE